MAIAARWLPRLEWSKLAETELSHLATLPPEQNVPISVLVVEEDTRIVACWSRTTVEHVEGVWEAPDVRGRIDITRLLLNTMLDSLRADGLVDVMTQAMTPEVEAIISKLGGRQLPGSVWVFPVR